MQVNLVARYWLTFGNYDAFCGRWDCPPVTIGIALAAYERGQRAARLGRFYRGHFFN
jgi:hypothetical protein